MESRHVSQPDAMRRLSNATRGGSWEAQRLQNVLEDTGIKLDCVGPAAPQGMENEIVRCFSLSRVPLTP
jgi:hypothetical protein